MMLSDFLLCQERAKGPIIAWGVVSIIHFVQIGKILFLPKQKKHGQMSDRYIQLCEPKSFSCTTYKAIV